MTDSPILSSPPPRGLSRDSSLDSTRYSTDEGRFHSAGALVRRLPGTSQHHGSPANPNHSSIAATAVTPLSVASPPEQADGSAAEQEEERLLSPRERTLSLSVSSSQSAQLSQENTFLSPTVEDGAHATDSTDCGDHTHTDQQVSSGSVSALDVATTPGGTPVIETRLLSPASSSVVEPQREAPPNRRRSYPHIFARARSQPSPRHLGIVQP